MNFPKSARASAYGRLISGTVALCALVAAGVISNRVPARGFDFQDTSITAHHPTADISDTYLFPAPGNNNYVVAVMDVYPSLAAGAGLTTYFDQGVLYTLKFDTKYAEQATGSRPVEDVVVQIAAGPPPAAGSGGTQQISVYGPAAPVQTGPTTKLISSVASGIGNINTEFSIDSGQVQVFAGGRRDPQFFAEPEFASIFPASTMATGGTSCLSTTCPGGFAAAGTNYFANTNVLSIVVQIPKMLLLNLGGGVGDGVAFWATTSSPNGS
jgi:hypothetical protein